MYNFLVFLLFFFQFFFSPYLESVPLLMTIVGGISSIAVLLILIIVVIIYFKCKKKKLPPADVISEHQISSKGGCAKEPGDRTSNYSDLKVDISAGYVPYADYTTHYSPPPQYLTTVANKTNLNNCGGDGGRVNSVNIGNNHNGTHTAVPLTYLHNGGTLTGSIIGSRENTMIRQDNGLPHLHQHQQSSSGVSSSPNGSTTSTSHKIQTTLSVDPRYSAIYGNPYLRNSNSSLLPPPTAV